MPINGGAGKRERLFAFRPFLSLWLFLISRVVLECGIVIVALDGRRCLIDSALSS